MRYSILFMVLFVFSGYYLPILGKSEKTILYQFGDTILVKKGTEVNLRLLEIVHSEDLEKGHFVDLEVDIDVIVEGGKKVINTGAYAIGQVVKLRRKGFLGKGAYIEIVPISVKAVDGTSISLNGAPIKAKGKNRTPLVIISGLAIGGITGAVISTSDEDSDFASGGMAAASLATFIEGAPVEIDQEKLFYATTKEDRLVIIK